MKKSMFLSLLLLITTSTFCQIQKKDKNYDLGVDAFNSGNYNRAISYFSLSIREAPIPDAIFNRAICYYKIGDSCNFCVDIRRASGMGDTAANKLFKEKCIVLTKSVEIPDSIKLKEPDADHFEIIYSKCSADSNVIVCFKNKERTWQKNISVLSGEVFTIVEIMPEFPGGDIPKQKFLSANVKYPKEAKKLGIQGTVYCQFIVEKDGSISNVKILRGVEKSLDDEILRVVHLMPNWIPGKQSGNLVRVIFNMPVHFNLSK
jgi:TonB family protein